MPYINTITNKTITKDSELRLKTQFGSAITLLHKTESWLMLNFNDNQKMYFQGDSSKPMAMVEVKLFGKSTPTDYQNMTRKITEIVSNELKIAPNCVYVKYEEVAHWGWNGNNF